MRTRSRADEVSVPDMVRRGVDRVHVQQLRAMRRDAASWTRDEVALAWLAELYRREARWWDVLANWVYSSRAGSTSPVFGKAAIVAHAQALEYAQRYDEYAASARRRAALDPVQVVA